MRFSASSRQAVVLAVILLFALVVFHSAPSERRVELPAPLASLNTPLADWQMVNQGAVEKDVQAVLHADETLIRDYVNTTTSERASLFVAYFRSQTTGSAPHSPKNCLPGSGWVASRADIIRIPVDGEAAPIPVNRYVVSKGETQAMVLYWYQSHTRVIASEYWSKLYLVYDSMRYRRSDVSIVRVIVPITKSESQAEQTAISWVRSIFRPIHDLLPA